MRSLKLFALFHLAALAALLTSRFAHGTADEVANKWANNLGNATTEMQAGVARVRVSPGQAAVAKKQKWVNAMTNIDTQNKWERKTGAVSLQSWQASMTDVGIQRAAQGAQQKKGKYQQALTTLLPFIDSVAATVRAMPDNTPGDREQRAIAMMRGMRGYKGQAS